jgi:aryl-alcohol dehydrogenase-like predicted oxidoreductase
LTGKFKSTSSFPPDDERHTIDFSEGHFANRLRQVEALRPVLTEDGRSMTQGALGWMLDVSDLTIPIPGFKTEAQVEELVATASLPALRSDQLSRVAGFQQEL